MLARFAQVPGRIKNVSHISGQRPCSRFQGKHRAQANLTPANSTRNMAASSRPPILDPKVFNADLYRPLLDFWLPSYPNASSTFGQEDIQRWFSGGSEIDARCQTLTATAVSALNPTAMPLPPLVSPEADKEQYESLAAPLVSLLDADSPLPRTHTALALALLLDQMPRNLFRGSAQPVIYTHYDRLARAFTAHLRARGLDRDGCFATSAVWRFWLNLPLQHSEDLGDHELFAVKLEEMLAGAREAGDESGVKFLELSRSLEDRHLGPLRQFGRYPWRNQWVGRESTEAEEKYLREGGDTFGTG